MKLSVVIPAYNEELSLPKFLPFLLQEIKKVVGQSYEIVIVNDGSTDHMLTNLEPITKRDKRIKIISLSRNFGKEIATTAGLFRASGDATMIIDADGQHPPELIGKFFKLWQDGYQVVIGVRLTNTKEGAVKKYGSKVFYRLFNSMSGARLIPGATDFRLIDREVRNEFINFTERHRITRGLIDWMGFKRTTVPFHASARIAGDTGYPFSKLVRLAFNSFISLSAAPLYLIGYVGVVTTVISLVLGLFVITEQLLLGDPLGMHITGTAMLSILTIFLVGIILVSQGLIAVYLSHVHAQTQSRPLFIVDKRNSVNI